MNDWLIIECEKEKQPNLREFIQANPILDQTMRTMLADFLKVNESSLLNWIQLYQQSVASNYATSKQLYDFVYNYS